MDLGVFMAATRRMESGAYDGRYTAIGRPVRGDRARGAYQIMGNNWDSWAAAAGMSGANWRSPAAQDRVAAHWMTEYYNRYGNWELVAAAWYGGGGYANRLAARGYSGPEDIPSSDIRAYVQRVKNFMASSEAQQYAGQVPKGFNTQQTRSNSWLFPVAGETQWTKGDYGVKHRLGNYLHNAIDIFAEKGTPIVSPVNGRVIAAGTGAKKGGNWAKILGDDGITYYFAHMKDAPVVTKGQQITAGRHIGFVGNTGSAQGTQPHLHFTMQQDGQSMNPSTFLSTAQAGGGAYKPMKGRKATPRMSSMVGGFVDQMANAIAGGERVDPRTLGLDQSQPTEVTEVQQDETVTEADRLTLETPTRSVTDEVGVV